jgi:hypothetical protein
MCQMKNLIAKNDTEVQICQNALKCLILGTASQQIDFVYNSKAAKHTLTAS